MGTRDVCVRERGMVCACAYPMFASFIFVCMGVCVCAWVGVCLCVCACVRESMCVCALVLLYLFWTFNIEGS